MDIFVLCFWKQQKEMTLDHLAKRDIRMIYDNIIINKYNKIIK